MTPGELFMAIGALVIRLDLPPTPENLERAFNVLVKMHDTDPKGVGLLLTLPRTPLPPSKNHPEKN